jgi:MFS family permease
MKEFSASLPKYRFILGSLIFIIRMYGGLVLLVPALYVSSIMHDLAITHVELGLLVASTMIACLISVFFTGLLVERFGAKQTASVAVILSAVGGYLVGGAPNYGMALLGRFLLGLGITWFIPATMPTVMTWFSAKEYGTITAILGQSISLGLMTHFLITPILFPPPNWREPHLVYATVGLILAILWALLGKGVRGELKKEETPYLARLKLRIPMSFKIKEVWLMSIFMFIVMGVGTATSSWAPYFYETVRGFPITLASMLMGWYNLVNIVSGLIGGLISDRLGLRKPFIILSGIPASLCYVIAITIPDPLGVYASMAIGVAWFAAFATFAVSTVPMEVPEMTPELISYAMSVILFFGFLGQTIMVPLVGYVISTISPYHALLINGTLYILVSICGFLCRETGPRVVK